MRISGAKRHTYSRTSMFIIATHNGNRSVAMIKAQVEARAIKNGTIALLVIILDK